MSEHRERLADEAERLFHRLITEFGDEAARPYYFELANLRIGMSALEIEGAAIDGEPFKLSDYRGKVVVLDFWGDW